MLPELAAKHAALLSDATPWLLSDATPLLADLAASFGVSNGDWMVSRAHVTTELPRETLVTFARPVRAKVTTV